MFAKWNSDETNLLDFSISIHVLLLPVDLAGLLRINALFNESVSGV